MDVREQNCLKLDRVVAAIEGGYRPATEDGKTAGPAPPSERGGEREDEDSGWLSCVQAPAGTGSFSAPRPPSCCSA